MQVDEEVKGDVNNLEVGGYENDSDDEREIKEQEENHKTINFTLSEAGKAAVAQVGATPSTLVVLACLHSQSLAKIMYGAAWQEIGTATSTKEASNDDSSKAPEPKTILTLYSFNAATPFYFAVPDVETMKTDAVSPVVKQLFGQLTSVQKVVVLKDLYRTKYPNQEELAQVPDGQLPRKTYMTSFVSPEDAQWLASSVGSPAHFMAPTGGFGAGCLVHCELRGISAFQVTVIPDGHYVTVESMQAFKPVLERLGLPSDVDEIFQKPSFRQVLKDANQRSTTIFS